MTRSKLLLTALISAFLYSISPVFVALDAADSATQADESTQYKGESAQYTAECTLPAEFVDPEAMAVTMANPAKFMELMALMGKPATAQALMNCSVDGKQWSTWMANMSDPNKMMNSMTAFMNPQMYLNWMTASMNPQTYQPMYSYMDPALYMQWMTASMNPQFYAAPMAKMMDPTNFQQMFEAMAKAPSYAYNTTAQ